jgi:hypothetical protein
MRISGHSKETFLYLNGITLARPLHLGEKAELLPASCSPKPDDMIAVSRSEIDIGVIALFLRSVTSQIRVRAQSPKDLAISAWNTVWDVVLLSAFCNCEVICNLQCDTPAEDFSAESKLEVTNYHLRGLHPREPHFITEREATWIENNILRARSLLDIPAFQNAVHCLATYRWHSLPRVQLAVLWAGIEGLFGVDSEIVFRLSLYAARFLEPSDAENRSQVFANVKRLYKQRSAAVHGAKIKGDLGTGVTESVKLLSRLLRQCVANGGLPIIDSLAP